MISVTVMYCMLRLVQYSFQATHAIVYGHSVTVR